MWIGRVVPSARPWSLEYLRLLEDSFAFEPASDISAIFARPAGTRCEIRLDFLDLPDPPEYHFTITLPPSPSGRGAGGEGKTLVFSSDSPPPSDARLVVDTVTDIVIVSLAGCRPEADTPLIVETTAERLETTFGAQIEIQPLPLQFVFTNTFAPAATPLQAWRRWDGAHAGPRGERHGLRGLLDAAEKHHIPLTLYDTNTPLVLSAIEAVGGTAQLKRMEQTGLLALPLGPAPTTSFLQIEISRNGLPLEARQTLLQSILPRLLFSDLPRASQQGSSAVQSASSASSVPSSVPPSVSISDSPFPSVPPFHPLSNPLLIGGDLQRSTWGTYEYAEPSFAWLKARPYFSIQAAAPPLETANHPIDAASLTQAMLAQADPSLAQNYAWLVPVLKAAALWAQNPAPLAECKDLCILASDTFYAVFNPRGGRLVLFFAGAEQVIGPTAQFFIGLSDRSQWDVSKGEAADPAQITGAFEDAGDVFHPYQADITENTIRFVSAEGREKTYRLTETGLQTAFSEPLETHIPLALSPHTRFTPGWAQKYRLECLPDGIRSQVAGGPMVRIQVTAGEVRAVDSFLEAIPFIASPEDPNLELSRGFFLPFPLTVVHLFASEVSLTVRP